MLTEIDNRFRSKGLPDHAGMQGANANTGTTFSEQSAVHMILSGASGVAALLAGLRGVDAQSHALCILWEGSDNA